jgi:hypothetical protein
MDTKKQIPVPLMIAVIALVVIVVGVIGWRALYPSQSQDAASIAQHLKLKERKENGNFPMSR